MLSKRQKQRARQNANKARRQAMRESLAGSSTQPQTDLQEAQPQAEGQAIAESCKTEMKSIDNATCTEKDSAHAVHCNWLKNFDPELRKNYNLAKCILALHNLEDRKKGIAADKAAHSQPDVSKPGISGDLSDRIIERYNKMDEDQKAVVDNLNVPYGHVVISGAAGCGKTCTAAFLIIVAMAAGMDLAPIEEIYQHDKLAAKKSTWIKPCIAVSGTQNTQLNDVAMHIKKETGSILARKVNILHVTDPTSSVGLVTKDGKYNVESAIDPNLSIMHFAEVLADAAPENTPRGKSIYGEFSLIIAWLQFREDNLNHLIAQRATYLERMSTSDAMQWQSQGRQEYKETIKEGMDHIIRQADVIIATPGVLAGLAGKGLINPTVVWFDEAYRATESTHLILLTRFENAIMWISSGDGIADKPSVIENSHLGQNEDSQQLNLSLAMRMELSARVPIFFLRTNWRAESGVSKCASRICYNDTLVEGNSPKQMSEPTKQCRQFLEKLARKPCQGPSLCIDLSGKNEAQVGTSWTNTPSANFIRDVVMLIFASNLCNEDGKRMKIVVVTPYEAQRKRLKQTIRSLSPAEYVPALVYIRTVGGAQGCEGDITIWDFTRTSAPGFIGQRHLCAIALTRARHINIIVGASAAWNGYHSRANHVKTLAQIWKYHKLRNAVAEYKGKNWEFSCKKCGGHHHQGKAGHCKIVSICTHCQGLHHIRKCATAPALTETTRFKGACGLW
ncbi:AAA domain-containing protein [Biscogniauxia sp. FL1348]|nr:AAA domain-containing protein [Biscogniauxia sp. FL1348]